MIDKFTFVFQFFSILCIIETASNESDTYINIELDELIYTSIISDNDDIDSKLVLEKEEKNRKVINCIILNLRFINNDKNVKITCQ